MVSLSLGLQVYKGNYTKALQAIATFPPQSSSGKRERHLASQVPRTADVVIHDEFLFTSLLSIYISISVSLF